MSLPDRDAEWLDWRRAGIGGSDAAAIAGLSPWKSPFVLWLEKTGQLASNAVAESEAMRWGTLLEPVIADEFETRTERRVIRRQTLWTDPIERWRRITLDGMVVAADDPTTPLGAYEGKTTSALRYGLDWSDGIPTHYAIQVQHTLSVLALDRAWVTCLVGGQRLEIIEVGRDEAAIELLVGMEREFWARVEGRLPPPPVDGGLPTTEAIRAAYPDSKRGKVVELGDRIELRSQVARLRECRDQVKFFEHHSREAQNRITAALGDAESGTLDGAEVVTWRAHERRSLDQSSLRAAEPELAERFTRTETVRTFLLKREPGN